MKKLRLPKPAATYVVWQHLYFGSVYTGKQMRNFAEKAVLLEREECAQYAENHDLGTPDGHDIATAIRARGNT